MTACLQILVISFIAASIGWLLAFAAKRCRLDADPVVEIINAQLPQIQCGQCGHPGCKPYAVAIVKGEAINRCPPGGKDLIRNLAKLLGKDIVPLDTNYGQTEPNKRAKIREPECIGCTLCIQACPVDAIIGAPQLMHVVLDDICTGCELCVAPCPVDCIDMLSDTSQEPTTAFPKAEHASCIRCGACENACPKNLQPQALFWHRESVTITDELGLSRCIECKLCDKTCPSQIPLTAYFQTMKKRQQLAEQKTAAARLADARYQKHQQRVQKVQNQVKTRANKEERAKLLARLKMQG